jgi:NhaA family Na+:H+ antiporter
MSLFIADLAFGSTSMLEIAKVGILAGSTASGIVGAAILSKRARGSR